MSGYQSGRAVPAAAVASMLSELLGALGFRAMALQAGAELDPEKLRLYARIIVKQAPAARRAEIVEGLERVGLL